MRSCIRVFRSILLLAALIVVLAAQMLASSEANASGTQAGVSRSTLSGVITDSLGAVIANARVNLWGVTTASAESLNADSENQSGAAVQSTTTDSGGRYSFALAAPGRYLVRAEAATFQPASSEQKFVVGGQDARIDLVLAPSMVAQQIVVTATGVPTPEEQTGSPISVIGEQSLATRRDVEEELRLAPGAQVTRTGQIGGVTALYVRGAPSDTNKTLIDGITVNDIGGGMNFGNLSAAGYEKAELYRGPNSALYGSDALGGVLVLTTRRGATPLPELTYAADGGSFGTVHQESSLGGAWRRFDYFSDASRFDTQNSTPNSEFHNGSFLGNLGWQLNPSTELRATVRRSVSAFNSASAIDLYGIADDGVSREQDTSFGATLENHANSRWHNLLRYAGLRLRSEYNNFGPTGTPAFDAFGNEVFLGKTVTIRGANGYQATGQAILQFGPGAYETTVLSDRDSVYAQTDYRWNSKLAALFGFQYEAEGGFTTFGLSHTPTARGNYSYMMQLNGGFWNRLYYTVGSGLENNSIFGFAATPRASLACHLVRPNDGRVFSGTRLLFSFAKGIREPSVYQETNSLYDLLLANAPADIALDHIHPFRAVRSRSYDGGVEQLLMHGRARLSVTYFHNEFGDQAEFVPSAGLLELGVPQSVITDLGTAFLSGAVANSLSYSAQGVEVEAEYRITRSLAVRGGWTYTDAVVQHSLSSDALSPTPNFGVLIGAFSPLAGARPFHIAPHTGFFSVDFARGRYLLRATGTLVSRRDDSDFLGYSSLDATGNYTSTLLLPNRNLDPAYQRIDLYGAFRINGHASMYTSMENLLDQRYYESFGYPALPFTIRSGVQFRFGGESWKL